MTVSGLFADVIFDMVTVDHPGNAADGLHGAIDYVYNIGTYETTVAQYTEFLNAKAQDNYYELYSDSMETSPLGPSIHRSGTSGSYTYSIVSGKENEPVRWVSLYDAMRFCNWLHNGQGDGDTEFGSYDLSLGLFADRQEGATWVIPSEDEWYKAAYYDPVNDCYYDYPNGTDDIPAEPTDGTSTRLFNFGDDPYWAPDGPWDYFTNIGETTGHSPYGAYDMGGNVEEWTDTMDVPYYQYRVTRGGHFTASEQQLRSSDYSPYGPDMDGARFGFRIAYIIPEPASCLLMLLGGLLFRKCRGRKSCWMSVC